MKNTKEPKNYQDLIGGKYFFRTVTYHLLGEVVSIVGRFAYLKDASWVADSGRFHQFITKGELSSSAEIEPVGFAYINLDTVTDFFPWKHEMLTEQK